MEIAEVVDRESLEAYLDALPDDTRQQTARLIAHRSAARVAPRAFTGFRPYSAQQSDLTMLSVFGCNSIIAVAAFSSTAIIAASATAASTFAATATASSFFIFAPTFAATATASTASSTAASSTAASSTAASSTAAFAAAILWQNVRLDLALAASTTKWMVPLWQDAEPPVDLAQDWTTARDVFAKDTDGKWQFWIKWYDRILAGKNTHPDLMAPILNTLTKDDWLGDPAAVNVLFDDVLAVYEAEDAAAIEAATPLGETVVYDGQQDLLVLRPLDHIQDNYLTTIHSQIASAVRVLNISGTGANAYQPLSDEVAILGDAQTIHADRPVLILKGVSRVLKRLERKIQTGDCPSATQDANIEDFQSILIDVQGELVGFNDEVRAYFNASRPPVSEKSKAVFIAGATATLPHSDPALRDVLEGAIADLENSELDVDAAKEAQYRIVGLLIRARKLLKNSAAFVKDASIVGGAAAAVTGSLAWFASPAFREFVTAAMKAFGL